MLYEVITRMMRAIRFANQLNFQIEENSFNAICKNADRIKIITGERIVDELNKILSTDKPSTGFLLLYKTGLLDIIFVITSYSIHYTKLYEELLSVLVVLL